MTTKKMPKRRKIILIFSHQKLFCRISHSSLWSSFWYIIIMTCLINIHTRFKYDFRSSHFSLHSLSLPILSSFPGCPCLNETTTAPDVSPTGYDMQHEICKVRQDERRQNEIAFCLESTFCELYSTQNIQTHVLRTDTNYDKITIMTMISSCLILGPEIHSPPHHHSM